MFKKTMITFLTAALAALTMAGCAENNAAPDAGYPLERFTLTVGSNIYHASIDQETHIATIGAIKYGGQVSKADYRIADGAAISPGPPFRPEQQAESPGSSPLCNRFEVDKYLPF